MGRAVIHPVVDRMLLGYAAAAFSAPYICMLYLTSVGALITEMRQPMISYIVTPVVGSATIGTLMLPVAFVAGLPMFLAACYLVLRWGVSSKWWFCGLGIFAAAGGAFLLLPMFNPGGKITRDLTDAVVLLAGLKAWAVLTPSGFAAGWIFWRVGIKPTIASHQKLA